MKTRRFTSTLFYLFTCLTCVVNANAQISGMINKYSTVSAIDFSCNTVTVSTPGNFAAGNLVMLIQMKGAAIDVTNTATYGNISAIKSAGNYELLRINSISGSILTFDKTISRTYELSGKVQLVYIPEYTNVSVDGTLTAQTWNGQTGGVLALSASGTVTLNADLIVDKQGFAGGLASENPTSTTDGGDCFSTPNYAYAVSGRAGRKGEGITDVTAATVSGRGKQANGGGGGNNHNSGGGGGSNYGGGGTGGSQSSGCGTATSTNAAGGGTLGATYIAPSNKLFLGGGGGGGQQNNGFIGIGGAGGGLIYINATEIAGNGHSLSARGESALLNTDDGAGGGGGGGTILIQNTTYTGALTVNANGGDGGTNYGSTRYIGAGGGGGGGTIWLSSATVPASMTATVAGGAAGVSFNGATNGGNKGASNGQAGGILFNLAVPKSSTANSCALPVTLIELRTSSAGGQFMLTWTTASEKDNAGYRIEKSTDGFQYSTVEVIKTEANSTGIKHYSYVDAAPSASLTYYRLIQVNLNGHEQVLGTKAWAPDASVFTLSLYPNPSNGTIQVQWISSLDTYIGYTIHSTDGTLIRESAYENPVFTVDQLSPGFYILTILSAGALEKRTFTVQ